MRIGDLFEDLGHMPSQSIPDTPGTKSTLFPHKIPGEKGGIEGVLAEYGITLEAFRYWTNIQKNCSEYINATKATKKVLFRGRRKADMDSAFVGLSHNDRYPANTSPARQREFDNILRAAGFKALRSNSIFATPYDEDAAWYGNLYIVFPFNGCSYTWSRKFTDLYSAAVWNYSSFTAFLRNNVRTKIDEKDPKAVCDALGFVNGDIEGALSSNNEVYIAGHYYIFPFHDPKRMKPLTVPAKLPAVTDQIYKLATGEISLPPNLIGKA